jgi:mediator of RNA polymerase II transcription subunit 14
MGAVSDLPSFILIRGECATNSLNSQPGSLGKGGAPPFWITRLPLSSDQISLRDDVWFKILSFVGGMMAHRVDIGVLNKKGIPFWLRQAPKKALSPPVKMPTIMVRLAQLLKPKNGGGDAPSRPWASELVYLTFQGLQNPPRNAKAAAASPGPTRPVPFTCIVEARLSVTDKTKFRLLRGKVDRDVYYNAVRGEFCLRIRADVGEVPIDLLVPRLRSLERLVDFVDAIQKGGRGIMPQSMTLRRINFSYGDANPASLGGGPAPLGAAHHAPQTWQVGLSMEEDNKVKIELDSGNPHVRVKDYLEILANDKFAQLPAYLLRSLPLLRVLDKIEDEWAPLTAALQGGVEVFAWSLERFSFRYLLPSTKPNTRRMVQFDIRVQFRKTEAFWHVRRADDILNSQNGNAATASPGDEFHQPLCINVWKSGGNGWKGLETSATAELQAGIEPLLEAINSTIRALPSPPSHSAQLMQQSQSQQHHASQGGADLIPPPSSSSSSLASTRMSQSSSSQQRHSQQSMTSVGGSQSQNTGRPPQSNHKGGGQVVVID